MKNLNHSYTTATAAKVTGLTVAAVQALDVAGIVVPSVSRAGGPGNKRRYSRADLHKLAMIADLRRAGANAQGVADALALAHANNGGRLAVLHRGPVVLLAEGDELPARAVLIDPAAVRDCVDLALAALGEPATDHEAAT